MTLIQILEKHCLISEAEVVDKNLMKNPNLFGQPFEQSSVDCGLQQICDHLSSAPNLMKQLFHYRRIARSVLDAFKAEELLLDMFRTEFHRQFLFGFRAADIDSDEKFDKLDKIVEQLAAKCESSEFL